MAIRFTLWLLVALLCGFGLVMVASTTAAMGSEPNQVNYSFLVKQLAAMGAGILGAWIVSRWLGTERLANPWWVAALVGGTILTLIAVLAVGREVNGAKRWIDVGPVNVQPSELAKVCIVIGLAWYAVRFAPLLRTTWYGILLPLGGFVLLAGPVYLTKDLGSVVVMAVVLSAMLAFAGARIWHFLGLVALIMPALVFQAAWSVGYRRDRMTAYLDPLNGDSPTSYHLKQSFIALGTGGVSGTGVGQGPSKLGFLPEKHTDFIFAVIGEEFGMIGGCCLAGAYLLLIGIGLHIAASSRDYHRRLLAVGATVVLGFQAFGNMLVVTGAVPTKGMTLPFISYGGTSVGVCLLLIGILDAVARGNAKDKSLTTTIRRGATARTARSITWHAYPPVEEVSGVRR